MKLIKVALSVTVISLAGLCSAQTTVLSSPKAPGAKMEKATTATVAVRASAANNGKYQQYMDLNQDGSVNALDVILSRRASAAKYGLR